MCIQEPRSSERGSSVFMEKIIFHVDVNSAFLSWSAVKRLKEDPSSVDLRTVPSIVGGDESTRHGIVTAASIPAKARGIRTAMTVNEAFRLCPGLITVSSDFTTYREYSRQFIFILHDYTDLVEQASIDEAYMDVSSTKRLYSSLETKDRRFPLSLAYEVKDRVKKELGFTVNVGISENCLLAKMASDLEKPDKVHTLFPSEIEKKMWPLPVRDLFGCGKATAGKLQSYGIMTIGDAARADIKFLKKILGEKAGLYIKESANGIGRESLETERADSKSYSNEITTEKDITAENFEAEATAIVERLSESVSKRLKKDGVFGKTVFVSIKTSDFKRHSKQTALSASTDSKRMIFDTAMFLLRELSFDKGKGLLEKGGGYRLIGVGVSGIDHGENRQLTLFELDENRPDKKELEREKKLLELSDLLDKKFGKGVIIRGKDIH